MMTVLNLVIGTGLFIAAMDNMGVDIWTGLMLYFGIGCIAMAFDP